MFRNLVDSQKNCNFGFNVSLSSITSWWAVKNSFGNGVCTCLTVANCLHQSSKRRWHYLNNSTVLWHTLYISRALGTFSMMSKVSLNRGLSVSITIIYNAVLSRCPRFSVPNKVDKNAIVYERTEIRATTKPR